MSVDIRTTPSARTSTGSAVQRAARALDTAVTALRANPTHPAVAEALHVAEFALTSLPAGVVATTMTRLLETAWDCHRSGVVGESRLVCRHSAAARALRLAG